MHGGVQRISDEAETVNELLDEHTTSDLWTVFGSNSVLDI